MGATFVVSDHPAPRWRRFVLCLRLRCFRAILLTVMKKRRGGNRSILRKDPHNLIFIEVIVPFDLYCEPLDLLRESLAKLQGQMDRGNGRDTK